MTQLGIIGDIDEIDNEVIRFYSFIGYCVSTTSEIEHMLFDCYYAASNKNIKSAQTEFYSDLRFAPKLKLANEAVQNIFVNTETCEIWNELVTAIDDLSGEKGSRNLISHNPLSMNIYVNDDDLGAAPLFELAVSRNHNQADAKQWKRRAENISSLRQYACDLHKTNMRLYHFFDTYLKQRYKPEK